MHTLATEGVFLGLARSLQHEIILSRSSVFYDKRIVRESLYLPGSKKLALLATAVPSAHLRAELAVGLGLSALAR